ncbi:Uncharacterized protein HZ326_14062 [Fusarium oxysporum f. sp. albedinis]|nr:Uncharacterized protein HZ326_14062 [Fusarium oxysporum f. sp. albedinis]
MSFALRRLCTSSEEGQYGEIYRLLSILSFLFEAFFILTSSGNKGDQENGFPRTPKQSNMDVDADFTHE